jgi:hypothetical protein
VLALRVEHGAVAVEGRNDTYVSEGKEEIGEEEHGKPCPQPCREMLISSFFIYFRGGGREGGNRQ